jgi:hypothetical protein
MALADLDRSSVATARSEATWSDEQRRRTHAPVTSEGQITAMVVDLAALTEELLGASARRADAETSTTCLRAPSPGHCFAHRSRWSRQDCVVVQRLGSVAAAIRHSRARSRMSSGIWRSIIIETEGNGALLRLARAWSSTCRASPPKTSTPNPAPVSSDPRARRRPSASTGGTPARSLGASTSRWRPASTGSKSWSSSPMRPCQSTSPRMRRPSCGSATAATAKAATTGSTSALSPM